MAPSSRRPPTAMSNNSSYSLQSASTSYNHADTAPTTQSRSLASRASSRPGTRMSRRTAVSTIGGGESNEIVCAVSEARGTSPTVGLSFINLSTSEAVISQICDNAFYARTINKIQVFDPTIILMMTTAGPPGLPSKLYSSITESCIGSKVVLIDRKYWSEAAGIDYIHNLSFRCEVEPLKVATTGNFYATCCLAAALKYIETAGSRSFSYHSLRIKYQPSEGTMIIDLSTIRSLELVQNLQDSRSKHCLFGLLNVTLTPMGSRCLRSNVLQPSTLKGTLESRYDAVDELSTKEEMFFETRQALKNLIDADKLLTKLIIVSSKPGFNNSEQAINNILKLKSFVQAIPEIHAALIGAEAALLQQVVFICSPENVKPIIQLIRASINDDVTDATKPLDLQNQRTYAVKSGVNGLLDVARQTYKEITEDVTKHIDDLNDVYGFAIELRFDTQRKYWLRISIAAFGEESMPDVFINCFKNKDRMECQTIPLVQLNQRLTDSSSEVVLMSDKCIQDLLEGVREHVAVLFGICEAIAMLDMLAAFAELVVSRDFKRPELTDDVLVITSGRHPIREKIHVQKFIPNDFYADQQSRFQILTGCNMSGKSTYIRTVALVTVMAQVGSFVPADFSCIAVVQQLFARVSMDDSIEANVSTFAGEMRETAYILRNVHKQSMVIIDELGRGTSTRDGLAIAIAIAEALIESHAFVWFATHFRELAMILGERNGVVNFHLEVRAEASRLDMLYKLREGCVSDTHYGLAFAQVVDLPPLMIEVATTVSQTLAEQAEMKKKSSRELAKNRRRKLVLGLRQQLLQAQAGELSGHALTAWLRKLQDVFVERMAGIEADTTGADDGNGTDQENALEKAESSSIYTEGDAI